MECTLGIDASERSLIVATTATAAELRAAVFATSGVPPLRQRLYVNGVFLGAEEADVASLLARHQDGGFDATYVPQPWNSCVAVSLAPKNPECSMVLHFCSPGSDGPFPGAGLVERSVSVAKGGVKATVVRKVAAASLAEAATFNTGELGTQFCVLAGGFPNGGEPCADVHAPKGTNHGGPPSGGAVVVEVVAPSAPSLPADGPEAAAWARYSRAQLVLVDACAPLPAVSAEARDLDEALEVARSFAASFGVSESVSDEGGAPPSAAELTLRGVLPHVPHSAVAAALARSAGRLEEASSRLLDASAVELAQLSRSAAEQPAVAKAVRDMREVARAALGDAGAAAKLMGIRRRIAANAQQVRMYEDGATVRKALGCIPLPLLRRRALAELAPAEGAEAAPPAAAAVADAAAAPCSDGRASYREQLLRELMHWFKRDFFAWVNSPCCEQCRGGGTSAVPGPGPTAEELRWGAQRVEVYRCGECGFSATRFPRYNHPAKLLETRRGRCGEWANCFTLCCRALAFDARHVMDWSDHVWTEVWSAKAARWLHCDPCEDACDAPLMYEAGWGKSLALMVAFARDHSVDVTRRYTRKYTGDVAARRAHELGIVDEAWLAQQIAAVDSRQGAWARESGGPEAKAARGGYGEPSEIALRALHVRLRKREEDSELDATLTAGVAAAPTALPAATAPAAGHAASDSGATRALQDMELQGRISGSHAWRASRGELGGAGSALTVSDTSGDADRTSTAAAAATAAAALFRSLAPLHSWVDTARCIVFTPAALDAAATHATRGAGRLQCELRSRSGEWRAAEAALVPGVAYSNNDGCLVGVRASTLDEHALPPSVSSADASALALVAKLFTNLIKRVAVAVSAAEKSAARKYRTIMRSNAKLRTVLFSSTVAVAALHHFGWVERDPVGAATAPRLRGGGAVGAAGEKMAYLGAVDVPRLRAAIARIDDILLR